MMKQILFLLILALGSQGFALGKAFSCKQVKMAPEEIILDATAVEPGTQQSLIVRKVNASDVATGKEYKVNSPASLDPKLKAQLSCPDVSITVSAVEGRASDGDYGYLAKFSGKGYAPQEMICWFFKHSR